MAKYDTVYDLYDRHISVPSPDVRIEYPLIYYAYFALKEVETVITEAEAGTFTYTFKGNNKIHDGNKNKIARIIANKINKDEKNINKQTETSRVASLLKNKEYKKGTELQVPLFQTKDAVYFNQIKRAQLTDEVYIVIETQYAKDMLIQIDVLQGEHDGIECKDDLINVMNLDGEGPIRVTVGEWSKDDDIANKEDFTDYAIANVKLRPTEEEALEDWRKKFLDIPNKLTYLYLRVDAHTHNANFEKDQIIYYSDEYDLLDCDIHDHNFWLNAEGQKFTLSHCNCGQKYTNQIQCTRYNGAYGPAYWGSIKLENYSHWDELVSKNELTQEEREILVGMSENEGKIDAVQSYDSEIVTVGAMQKTVNPKGKGEFPKQVADFKQKHPEKYYELFVCCGWTVSDGTMYYKDPDDPASSKITGPALKKKIRIGFDSTKFKKKVKCKPLEPLIHAALDKDFQTQQVKDFIIRLADALNKKPKDHKYPIKDYLKSKLGKATALDHDINRPG